jgi:hypothetical protein
LYSDPSEDGISVFSSITEREKKRQESKFFCCDRQQMDREFRMRNSATRGRGGFTTSSLTDSSKELDFHWVLFITEA